MNQTRAFLVFAWLMVATLLWLEWTKDGARQAAIDRATPAAAVPAAPGATPAVPPAAVPGAPAIPQAGAPLANAQARATATPATPSVTVTTDVLRVELDGGTLRQADLLRHPSTADARSAPVRLLASDPATYFTASSGWQSTTGAAPGVAGFVPAGSATALSLAPGQDVLAVPFVWTGPDGVSIRRVVTFRRGQYVVDVADTVVNAGTAPWSGHVERHLVRVPRAPAKSGFTSPEAYSFQGAAWYSQADRYEKRKWEDYLADGAMDKQVTGGWISMLQHHFFAAWIPQKDQPALFSLSMPGGRHAISARGPGFTVAPGTQATTTARLWVGPKLVNKIAAQGVPGLHRAVDFSSYAWAASLAGGLFWVLDRIHSVTGNWGWAIVGLVVLLRILLFPLAQAQYKSAAKMRKFAPRMAQLKERYGEDRQKFQVALMELYRKEKINPLGGCWPLLVQMPIFLVLYWMLSESVELRHAPWIGWIHDLTARDPYFVLPAINMAVMWATQKLTPAIGMDPMQAKMLQWMPVVFGVMFAFFPSGLVLYWVTNGALGLAQQWWMIRRYADEPAPKAQEVK